MRHFNCHGCGKELKADSKQYLQTTVGGILILNPVCGKCFATISPKDLVRAKVTLTTDNLKKC